jgi:hypothetical protein
LYQTASSTVGGRICAFRTEFLVRNAAEMRLIMTSTPWRIAMNNPESDVNEEEREQEEEDRRNDEDDEDEILDREEAEDGEESEGPYSDDM